MRPKPDALLETTPAGRLEEGELGSVLGYQLAQATVTTAQVFSGAIGPDIDLRPVEYTALALIRANPGLTASQLASALAVTPPNITMWLDRLEGRGLVERERSETDRRAQHVSVTATGASLADLATRRLIASEQAALAGLSAGERAMLIELLHKAARCRRKSASAVAGAAKSASVVAGAAKSASVAAGAAKGPAAAGRPVAQQAPAQGPPQASPARPGRDAAPRAEATGAAGPCIRPSGDNPPLPSRAPP